MTKIAYSYIRFSTKKQVTETSIAVQMERVRKYAVEHGYDLREKSYDDLGVSAFKGKNIKEGGLSRFLEAVEEGKVPPDSTLIIENLDRISRAHPWDALPVFMNIINSGITIVTLADQQVYTRKDTTSNNGMTAIFGSLMVLVRAHEESVSKSDRAKKGIRKQLNDGLKVGKAPFWLRTTFDRRDFEVIEAKADIVREVFSMRLEGIGALRLAQHLNTTYGFRWGTAQVMRLLMNPAVIGTKLSQVGGASVLDYYRPIMDKTLYYTVQNALNAPGAKKRGRRPDDVPNLFPYIARCALCNGALQFFRENKSVSQQYLKCRGALGKLCTAGFVNYGAFEKEVIGWLLLDPDEDVIELMGSKVPPIDTTAAETRSLEEQRDRLHELVRKIGADDAIAAQLKSIREQLEAIKGQVPAALIDDRWDEDEDVRYAQMAFDLVERLEDARLSDDKAKLKAVRRELQVVFAGSLETIKVFPEERVDDTYRCSFSVHFRRFDGVLSREYTRPALTRIKGVWNGTQQVGDRADR